VRCRRHVSDGVVFGGHDEVIAVLSELLGQFQPNTARRAGD